MTKERKSTSVLITALALLLPALIALFALSPADAFTLTPYTIPDKCVVMTDQLSVFPPLLRQYKCRIENNKIEVELYGVMMTAPPGIYRDITNGQECRAGKDGILLSCRTLGSRE